MHYLVSCLQGWNGMFFPIRGIAPLYGGTSVLIWTKIDMIFSSDHIIYIIFTIGIHLF